MAALRLPLGSRRHPLGSSGSHRCGGLSYHTPQAGRRARPAAAAGLHHRDHHAAAVLHSPRAPPPAPAAAERRPIGALAQPAPAPPADAGAAPDPPAPRDAPAPAGALAPAAPLAPAAEQLCLLLPHSAPRARRPQKPRSPWWPCCCSQSALASAALWPAPWPAAPARQRASWPRIAHVGVRGVLPSDRRARASARRGFRPA